MGMTSPHTDVDFLQEFRNKIICGNNIDVMKKMPDESVDLIITSPPYNLRNSTGNWMKSNNHGKWTSSVLANAGYDSHNDNMPHEDYVEWQRDCLKEMMRLLPDTGAIFYNHKWRVQNGLMQDRQDIVSGFPVRQIIIWARSGGVNFNDGYFLPTYEVIYLIAKRKFKLIRGACGAGDIWKFNQSNKNPHPAPFPIALPEKIISSTDAKVVLDPFVGSGTTAIAAKQLNRDYIGIDISEKYCQMAMDRLQKVQGCLL